MTDTELEHKPLDATDKIYKLEIDLIFGPCDTKAWTRVVEMPECMPLSDIHYWIIDAIEFDNDHMFDFYYGDKHGRMRERLLQEDNQKRYEVEDENWDEITLSYAFPMKKRNRWFYYMFDFGDSWTFRIKRVGRGKPAEIDVLYPNCISKVGENPEQYPDWED